MHVNVKIYILFQMLLVWTFTEYYMNIFGGAERYSGPPRNNFGGAAAPPLPTPLNVYRLTQVRQIPLTTPSRESF